MGIPWSVGNGPGSGEGRSWEEVEGKFMVWC